MLLPLKDSRPAVYSWQTGSAAGANLWFPPTPAGGSAALLPHPVLPHLTPPRLASVGAACSAPKSPWRDPAGSLLLRLLSRLSVDFNGCVL